MGVKPFLKSVRIEIPSGEDGFWSIIQKLAAEGAFSIGDVAGLTNVSSGTVSAYCQKLIRGGYLERDGERPHPRKGCPPVTLYRLAKPVELPPRLDRDGNQLPELQIDRIWRTIKMLRTFSSREVAREIAPEATEKEREKKVHSVRSYLFQLHRVGVIARVDGGPQGIHGGGLQEARYQLVDNLGARAPRILAAKIVFDPNAGAVVGAAETKEASR